MTFEAFAPLLADDSDIVVESFSRAPAPRAFPANDVADPESGWATRNPDRALLFLFVNPRDCAAIDELMAL
jgi:hypothetical protein